MQCLSRLNLNPVYRPDGSIKRFPETHNDYVKILYELGLVGFIVFLWMVSYTVFKFKRLRHCIPRNYRWLWEGQLISLMNLLILMMTFNAFTTVPFWFVLAGPHILLNATNQKSADVKEN